MWEQPLADHAWDVKACLNGLDLTEAEWKVTGCIQETDLSRMQVTSSLSLSVGHQVRLCKTKGAVFPVLSQCFSQPFLKTGSLSATQPQRVLCRIAFHLKY